MTTNPLARIEKELIAINEILALSRNYKAVARLSVIIEQDLPLLKELVEATKKGNWSELAAWLDMKFHDDANPEIQRDLRALDKAIRALQERQA